MVYNDADGSGTREVGEAGLAGWTVYLDTNANGSLEVGEPTTLTDAAGRYTFEVEPGVYWVRQVAQSGWTRTEPSSNLHFVFVSDGQATVDRNFGNIPTTNQSAILGTVYDDRNENGRRDAGEPGLAGWTVYLDSNFNGVLDANEVSTQTDAQGAYRFDVDPGFHVVRQVAQAGWSRTQPTGGAYFEFLSAGSVVTARNFGNESDLATLSGTVYDDRNEDGARGPGEPGLAGWTVYLDANSNGVLDPGEISTTTDAQGTFSFLVLPGSHDIRSAAPSGWSRTAPVSGVHSVTVGADQVVGSLDFGYHRDVSAGEGGAISGAVYDDRNNNGVRDVGEDGLAGWTVYLDLNFNGLPDTGEPLATTDDQGLYSFEVEPGAYAVRSLTQAGWVGTAPPTGVHLVTVTAGQPAAGRDFGYHLPTTAGNASLAGVVFNDQSNNGAREPGEPGLAGWTVYLDANNNGALDPGESSTTTDALGAYSFSVAPGTHVVRSVAQAGWSLTAPGTGAYLEVLADGDVRVDRDFGYRATQSVGRIEGVVFDDLDRNGLRGPGEPGLAGWMVFIDTNFNGSPDPGEPVALTDASGAYAFTATPGLYAVRLQIQTGWAQTSPSANIHFVMLTAGQVATGRDFGNRLLPTTGAISGVIYDDRNTSGAREAGEPGLAGWTVYLDANNNGALDPDEITTTTDAQGAYRLDAAPGPHVLRQVVQANWMQTEPAGASYNVSVTAGLDQDGLDFGNRTTLATLSGTVYDDRNRDASRQAGEPGLAGWTVYLDANNNGTLDPGEITTTTDALGAYAFQVAPGTHTVRQVLQTDWGRTEPSDGAYTLTVGVSEDRDGLDFGNHLILPTVSGVVYDDRNSSGSREAGEPGLAGWTVYLDANNNGALDTGEIRTTTDALGAYSFTVNPGLHIIRSVAQAGWSLTAPAGGLHSVTVDANQDAIDLDFGYRPTPTTATLSGVVFNDLNANGARNAGEPGLAGWTIYLDQNFNGLLDPGEVKTLSDESGRYSFTVDPGFYIIRQVAQPGWTQTQPFGNAYFIAATANVDLSGLNFGNRANTTVGLFGIGGGGPSPADSPSPGGLASPTPDQTAILIIDTGEGESVLRSGDRRQQRFGTIPPEDTSTEHADPGVHARPRSEHPVDVEIEMADETGLVFETTSERRAQRLFDRILDPLALDVMAHEQILSSPPKV